MKREVPLILLSGMGADERLFHHQREAFPQLIVPMWIEPEPQESLASYARRLALLIDPDVPCFVGGASFGGLVAMEMARHLDTIACFLIASVRSTDELPWQIRVLRPLNRLGTKHAERLIILLPLLFKPLIPKRTWRKIGRYTHPDAAFLRWASLAVLSWKPTHQSAFPNLSDSWRARQDFACCTHAT